MKCLRHLLLAVVLAVLPIAADAKTYQPATAPPSAATCPSDTVVWVNTKSGIYHLPGMRWYGRTAEGAYMCRGAAEKAGYRSTHNGQ